MNSDTLKGQWKQMLGKAKTTWSKITDDELLKVEGNAQRLSGLVQERYGVAREEAESQVQKFLDSASAKVEQVKDKIASKTSSATESAKSKTSNPSSGVRL